MYRYIAILLCVFFFGTSCKEQSSKKTTPSEATKKTVVVDSFPTLEALARHANEGTLETLLKTTEVQQQSRWVAEGTLNVQTKTLFPDSDREIQIDFLPKDSTRVWRVTATGNDGRCRSATGVYLGMPVKELNRRNGVPVNFMGWGWDYGGAVQFNNGSLANKHLFLYLSPITSPPESFLGDTPYASTDPRAKALELYVSKIVYEAAKPTTL